MQSRDRSILEHTYSSFDFDVLWETVTENIPELLEFCERELVKEN